MEESDLILKQWRIEVENEIGLNRVAMFLYLLSVLFFAVTFIYVYDFFIRIFDLHNSPTSQFSFFFLFQVAYTVIFIFMTEKLNTLIDFLSKKIYFFRNKEYKEIEKELKRFD